MIISRTGKVKVGDENYQTESIGSLKKNLM